MPSWINALATFGWYFGLLWIPLMIFSIVLAWFLKSRSVKLSQLRGRSQIRGGK